MPRTILIHLNVQVPDDDPRTADGIIRAVEGAIEVGLDPDNRLTNTLEVVVAMAEEI